MISLCITTYNRPDLTIESFEKVIDHPSISEIVIVDDHSSIENYDKLVRLVTEKYQYNKISIYRNDKNIGCYHNKRAAVSRASNEWVILLDSDNVIDQSYIDCLIEFKSKGYWNSYRIIQPIFAKPHFDFRKYSGLSVWNKNVNEWAGESTFTTALNAMNYFVNRDEFLRVFEDRSEPWTADSILINYNWLKAGNSIYFCPGMEYFHRVHDGSHYKEHHRKTGNLFNEIVDKLKAMR